MTLKERMEKLRDAGTPQAPANYEKKETNNILPLYGTDGRVVKKKSKKINKTLLITLPIIGVAAAIAGVIYLPQFFVSESSIEEYLLPPTNDAVSIYKSYLNDNGEMDFDNDGLSNADEQAKGTNPYDLDSDDDGIIDGADRNPLSKDDDLYNAKIASGLAINKPCEIDGVILWPADNDSLAHGSVVKTMSGYQFTNFKGWAKFSFGEYAYIYEDGVHSMLKYREEENAWKIPGSCAVILTDELLEETNIFSFFGLEARISNKFGGLLSAILPNKGWITCSRMLKTDADPREENSTVELDVVDIHYDAKNAARYGKNDIALSELSKVYSTLEERKTMLVSLFDHEAGESILEIYGYTESGNLLVADPNKPFKTGVLTVTPSSTHIKDIDGNVTIYQYYEFDGCGFSSESGDTISFFAVSAEAQDGSNGDVNNPNDNIPENGTLQVNGETYYFINKLVVTESFIRFYNGKYEICDPLEKGAFYVSKDKVIQKGLIDINGTVYIYADGAILRDTFVSLSDDGTYAVAEDTSAATTLCVNTNGLLIRGWFAYDSVEYYADPETGIIQKNVFVKFADESNRYLDDTGKWVSESYVRELDSGKWEICDISTEGAIWLGTDGKPVTGWYIKDTAPYFADPETGVIQKNIVATYTDGTKRYLGDNGIWVQSCYVKELEDGKWEPCEETSEGAIWVDASGRVATGWYVKDGTSYYANTESGIVQKNIIVTYTDGSKRYLDSTGKWVTSCYIKELGDGKWEACDVTTEGAIWVGADGIPTVGWYSIGGVGYYADEAGIVQKSRTLSYSDGTKRYLSNDGKVAVSCYVKDLADGKWDKCELSSAGAIWLTSNGSPATGWYTKDGKTYYANSSGVVQKNTVVTRDGSKRFLNSNGLYVTSCYVKELGNGAWKKCSLEDSGSILLNSDGKPTTGWFTINKLSYYASKSTGVIQKGCFIKGADGKWRYLNKSGEMMRYGSATIDGVVLSFDSQGRLSSSGDAVNKVINAHQGKE